MRSYKKLSTYRKHVSRGCRIIEEQQTLGPEFITDDVIEEQQTHDPEFEDATDPNVETTSIMSTITQQWHEARFILSIKEQHVISQAAVDQVLTSTTTLMSTLLDKITADLESEDPEKALQRVCEAKDSLFSGLTTAYNQQKYFAQYFHLVVRNIKLLTLDTLSLYIINISYRNQSLLLWVQDWCGKGGSTRRRQSVYRTQCTMSHCSIH